MDEYGGNIDFVCEAEPEAARKELLSIEGVGPKTADCVLLFSCGDDVIPVDTHVFRVTKRLGIVPEKSDHEDVHRILMEIVPAGKRGSTHVDLIRLGREICKAQNPKHERCFLIDLCDYARQIGAYPPKKKPAPDHKFLVDRMLGRLIAWLRIFGYDTKSALDFEPNSREDTMLIELAAGEKRILVSRDRVLVERAKKAGVDAVLLNSDDVKEQLEELMKDHPLNANPNMTRCTVCNSLLREATEADIGRIHSNKEVPEHLVSDHALLWICDHCGKVYWQGSHWRNITKTAEEVKARNNNRQNKTN